MKNLVLNILIPFLILLHMFPIYAYCESPDCLITGIVLDKHTLNPIANANVFLAHTLTGSSTDKFGHYTIKDIYPGQYFLVVSHVGYEDLYIQIKIRKNEKIKYNFNLLPKIYQMKPIIVLGDSTDWKKNLKRFLKEFLGTSKNSEMTSIHNIYNLDFNNNGDTLWASATNPLEITNKALGYKIVYSLFHFESANHYVKYTGFPQFIEIESNKPENLKDWKINRRNTYQGSLRHFLKVICLNYALTVGKTNAIEFEADSTNRTADGYKINYTKDNFIKRSGFEVLSRSTLGSQKGFNPVIRSVNTNSFLKPSKNESEMYFMFDNYLEIRYRNPNKNFKENISWITLEKDSILIDKAGRFYETFSIKTSGYWGNERISDLLPLEYLYNDSSVLYIRD